MKWYVLGRNNRTLLISKDFNTASKRAREVNAVRHIHPSKRSAKVVTDKYYLAGLV